MDYLSLCLICKDENDYLPEWLDYHILAGIDRFYIFDNDSSNPLRNTLKAYIEKGWVVVIEIGGRGAQLAAYDNCLRSFGANTRWMGFIDSDEFLVAKQGKLLPEILRDYEGYGGLAVSSLFFGSNQYQKRPIIGQIAAYTQRTHETYYENTLVKCIVEPDKVEIPASPHDFIYKPGFYCVNEKKQRVDFQRYPHSTDILQLNHYFCRSAEEIEQKLQRGRGDRGAAWKIQRFSAVNSHAIYEDRNILFSIEHLSGRKRAELQPSSTLRILRQEAEKKRPSSEISQDSISLKPCTELADYLALSDRVEAAEASENYLELVSLQLNLIRQYPQRALCYVDLATCYLKLQDPAAAWQALSQAWQIAKNSFYVLRAMVHYFLRVKNYAMAEKSCALALQIAPNDLTILGFLTEAYIGQGRYLEALRVGMPVLELSNVVGEMPDGMTSFLIRGLSALAENAGDVKTWIALQELGSRNTPDDLEMRFNLARAYTRGQRKQDAMRLLVILERSWPDDQRIAQLRHEVEND